jgi:hypothetical protein
MLSNHGPLVVGLQSRLSHTLCEGDSLGTYTLTHTEKYLTGPMTPSAR